MQLLIMLVVRMRLVLPSGGCVLSCRPEDDRGFGSGPRIRAGSLRELPRREALILGFGCACVIFLVAFGWLRILRPSEGHCCPAGAAGGKVERIKEPLDSGKGPVRETGSFEGRCWEQPTPVLLRACDSCRWQKRLSGPGHGWARADDAVPEKATACREAGRPERRRDYSGAHRFCSLSVRHN